MIKSRFFSLTLILLIVFFGIVPVFSAYEEAQIFTPVQTAYENEMNKLHFYFGNSKNKGDSSSHSTFTLKSSTSDDYLFIDDENELDRAIDNMNDFCENYAEEDELVQVTVEFQSDFDETSEYIAFSKERETLETMEEIREFKVRLNTFSKQYHQMENERNIKLLEQFDYKNISIIGYAPFVVMEMEKESINTENFAELAGNDDVVNVSFSLYEEAQEDVSWNNTLKEIEAYSTVHSGLYTGAGVRIGVLEANAVCDVNHENLSDKSITVDERCNNETAAEDSVSHANAVTSIIALMAPDAEFYVSSSNQTKVYGVQWFIDNNCDVVNCSFSNYGNQLQPDGTYVNVHSGYRYDIDGVYDYQISNNYITVVTTSSNVSTDTTKGDYNPNGDVRSPGSAYNSITVGGVTRKLDLLTYNLYHHTGAGFRSTEPCVKPEITAIFDVDIPNMSSYSSSGTSFAAPQVTGAIALLMEKDPYTTVHPIDIKARIITSANKTEDYIADVGCFDDRVGAGSLDLQELLNLSGGSLFMKTTSNSVSNSIMYSKSVELEQNEVLQTAISWYANVDYETENTYYTNYDLRLYNSSGALILESAFGQNSTIEFIRYTAPSAGTYTISIYQNGEKSSETGSEYISFWYNLT